MRSWATKNDAGNTVTMLVARVRADRMTLATAVPTKSTGEFVVNRVIAFLKEVGIEKGDVIAKSDQEPSILSLIDEIGKEKATLGQVDRGELSCGLAREQWSGGKGNPERGGPSEGDEERAGGAVEDHHPAKECCDSLANGVRRAPAESL